MTTKWMGLWKQDRQGYYAGQVIAKGEIPKYTRIVLRYNKYYDKEGNKPRFVYCFADSEGYESRCVPIEMEEKERVYTADEVYHIIHGMEEKYDLPYGDDLIEDYII